MVTLELRVYKKTPAKRNKILKNFFNIIQLTTPAHPIGWRQSLAKVIKNISMSKTTENYRYTIGRLLSRYQISIGESDKELLDVQGN